MSNPKALALFRPNPNTAWGGRTPHKWQAEALEVVLGVVDRPTALACRGVVHAATGTGKSLLQAEICRRVSGRILITVPTQNLVRQLHRTFALQLPETVGQYYQKRKDVDCRITICCHASLAALVAEPGWSCSLSLWMADEAHRTESEQVLSCVDKFASWAQIGFTATAYRTKQTESLSIWDREIYKYTIYQAIRDKVIVDFRVVHWKGDSLPILSWEQASAETDRACIAMIREASQVGSGVVDASTIDDAEDFAAALNAAGITAAAVHSKLEDSAVSNIMDRSENGSLSVVVHVNMLAEGVDYPWLRWLCMRRVCQSQLRFTQQIGRVLRAYPDKAAALILDPHDLFGRFNLNKAAVFRGMTADEFESDFREFHEEVVEYIGRGSSTVHMPVILNSARRYIRHLYLSTLQSELSDPPPRSTYWRASPPSTGQLNMLYCTINKLLQDPSTTEEHRKCLLGVYWLRSSLSKGDCSDLIDIIKVFDRISRSGRNPWACISSSSSKVEVK